MQLLQDITHNYTVFSHIGPKIKNLVLGTHTYISFPAYFAYTDFFRVNISETHSKTHKMIETLLKNLNKQEPLLPNPCITKGVVKRACTRATQVNIILFNTELTNKRGG